MPCVKPGHYLSDFTQHVKPCIVESKRWHPSFPCPLLAVYHGWKPEFLKLRDRSANNTDMGEWHGLIVIHEEGVWLKAIIRENQRGYLLKNGKFIRLLKTGKHSYYPLFGQIIETVPVNGAVNTCGIDVSILCQDPMFEKSTVSIQVLDNTIALHRRPTCRSTESWRLPVLEYICQQYFWNDRYK